MISHHLVSIILSLLLVGLSTVARSFPVPTNSSSSLSVIVKPARMAVMAFRADGTNEESRALAQLCEESLVAGLSRIPDLELVEREQIEKVLEELALSGSGSADDVLKTGELLGANLMIVGRIGLGYANRRVEVIILEVATGNPLAALGADWREPYDSSVQKLVDGVVKILPELLQARRRDAGKPAAAILNVKNISRLKRLDFLEPAIRGVLEEAVAGTKRYRLLRREHVEVARTETELSFGGWTRLSDTVLAERADITLIAELEEQYKPGLTFQETPLVISVTCKYRDGRQTKWQVSGQAGDLRNVLRQLMNKVRTGLSANPLTPLDSFQSQSLEALDLFKQAVGEKSWDLLLTAETAPVSTGIGNDPAFLQCYYGHTQVDESRKIALLEQALYLDPSLMIARFFLGYSLWRTSFGMADKDQAMKINRRAARELDIFLELGPRGEFREVAYHDLIICYAQLGEWPRAVQLLKRYMTEAPKKHMSDHLHGWGFIYYANVLHDDEKTIQWEQFLNEIYGKEHLKYNVGCPFLSLAEYFLHENKPEKALGWYERAVKEHGCGLDSRTGSVNGDQLLENIYSAMGRTNEAYAVAEKRKGREKREIEGSERSQRFAPRQMTNVVPVLPELPAELQAKIRSLDAEQKIRAVGFHTSGTYVFTVSGRNIAGYGGVSAWAEDTYETSRLLYWPGAGAGVTELNMRHERISPRITVILPFGEHVWFGTHEGLARYHPKKGTWNWYSAEHGLPVRKILCGAQIGGEFWFGGPKIVFSFNPKTEQFRAYLPDMELEGDFLWIEPSSSGVGVYNRWAHFVIDPISGKWHDIH